MVNKLTEFQIKFLLKNFFKREDIAGWETIATNLIMKGECIVAGTKRIWCGGVGNFIDFKPYPDAYECTIMTFRKDEFFNSVFFKDKLQYSITKLRKEYEAMALDINDLEELW